jgi:hypothetical protein
MEWDFKENRVAVIALHKCGKSYQIFKLSKPLKISRNFICRAIKRYEELWGVEDRARSGCLKSVRAEAGVKTVRERIRRKPSQAKPFLRLIAMLGSLTDTLNLTGEYAYANDF